ncbi:MAG TPA: hypothetical protein VJ521_06480, partial [Acidobacteriota bacterium]|nr:hypothetical protein [Acidobacteriota bacterium]
MKKATLLGGEDVIYSALGIKEEAFNEQFHHYLREKFSDYRSKQSPVDYGKEVALPAKYRQIFSQAVSPDASQFVVMTSNRDDYEFDILKIDRAGKVIDNLTGGSTTSYEYLTTDSFTFEGRNLSWSANGARIAYFARTGKLRSLFVLDAADGDLVKKIKLKIDQAGSPALSPDGRRVVITGFLEGKPDLFLIDIETEAISHLTNDILYEKSPIWSKDGKWLYYTTRVRSRDQIMRMDPSNSKAVEQITSSDYDSTSPYYDAESNSIYYAANKGGAYNIYRLDLNTGDKLQFTDTIGSNFSPIVFHEGGKETIAFTSFFKGQYRFFIMDLPQPMTIIAKGSEEAGEGTLKPTSEQLAKKFGAPGATVPT